MNVDGTVAEDIAPAVPNPKTVGLGVLDSPSHDSLCRGHVTPHPPVGPISGPLGRFCSSGRRARPPFSDFNVCFLLLLLQRILIIMGLISAAECFVCAAPVCMCRRVRRKRRGERARSRIEWQLLFQKPCPCRAASINCFGAAAGALGGRRKGGRERVCILSA